VSDPLAAPIGLVGAIATLPRRIAAREVARRGGDLHRGVTRRTAVVIFGRTLLARDHAAGIEARVAAARGGGRLLRSEAGFLRMLAGAVPEPGISRQEVLVQSRLAPETFDLLALFDAFERDVAPFSFRDVILARKYAGLLAGGAGWNAIARSVHRFGPAVSLTAKALEVGERQAIYAAHPEGPSELDGQLLLGLAEPAEAETEELFAAAEAAEAGGRHAEAAALFGRCLGRDPADAVAAFNRANCLRADGREAEAEAEFARALAIDPGFVEAWFNLGCLVAARGRAAAARRHLERAVALDPDYADPVFNLASLAFEAGDIAEARRWWLRYLELDPDSEWGRQAARGVQFADLQARGSAG
jgi:tetratricopeptide (TPR) repeat protein